MKDISMCKTQPVLIGNPLELTKMGILELHKLMHKETYLYKWSFVIPNDLSKEEKLDYFLNKESEYKLVGEEDFLKDNDGIEYRIISSTYVKNPNKNNTDFTNDDLLFYGDWVYPSNKKRIDPLLLQLFNTDVNKDFFVYENNPRVYDIPTDFVWYIDENEMGEEFIHEKGRIWG